ncbi:MAG TPA: hypothetical protein VLK30_10590 [Candidatus Limnocylindrales bacterium]|nr:hypothetical protein [Candidatus Limnocylindrales bacterium]
MRATASVGTDAVAVIASPDGGTAFLADSSPGDVYAVSVPGLKVQWKAHVGGAPFAILIHEGRLYVSLFDSSSVAELDPATGRVLATDPTPAHPAAIAFDAGGHLAVAAGDAFGIALLGDALWTADYKRAVLQPVGTGRKVGVPLGVHPFWLAAGSGGTLLIAAEGAAEDSDPGAVFSYDDMTGSFRTLARPHDPDQVIESGQAIFVPAHGDHEVLAIEGGVVRHWAHGASAVAVAADPPQNLLVVAVNAHE